METKIIIKVVINNTKEEIPPHANVYNGGKEVNKNAIRSL